VQQSLRLPSRNTLGSLKFYPYNLGVEHSYAPRDARASRRFTVLSPFELSLSARTSLSAVLSFFYAAESAVIHWCHPSESTALHLWGIMGADVTALREKMSCADSQGCDVALLSAVDKVGRSEGVNFPSEGALLPLKGVNLASP
jgi:hypothetical protein